MVVNSHFGIQVNWFSGIGDQAINLTFKLYSLKLQQEGKQKFSDHTIHEAMPDKYFCTWPDFHYLKIEFELLFKPTCYL